MKITLLAALILSPFATNGFAQQAQLKVISACQGSSGSETIQNIDLSQDALIKKGKDLNANLITFKLACEAYFKDTKQTGAPLDSLRQAGATAAKSAEKFRNLADSINTAIDEAAPALKVLKDNDCKKRLDQLKITNTENIATVTNRLQASCPNGNIVGALPAPNGGTYRGGIPTQKSN
jgi:hypothetical protein